MYKIFAVYAEATGTTQTYVPTYRDLCIGIVLVGRTNLKL